MASHGGDYGIYVGMQVIHGDGWTYWCIQFSFREIETGQHTLYTLCSLAGVNDVMSVDEV